MSGLGIQTMKEREESNERSGERERSHFHKGRKYTSTEQAGLGQSERENGHARIRLPFMPFAAVASWKKRIRVRV